MRALSLSIVVGLGGIACAAASFQSHSASDLPINKALFGADSLEVRALEGSQFGTFPLTVTYSKPNRFRIEDESRLTVSDGTTLTEYDKASNTYYQEPASLGRISEPDVWAFSGFFESNPFGKATDLKTVDEADFDGKPAKQMSMKLPVEVSADIFLSHDGHEIVGSKLADGLLKDEVRVDSMKLGGPLSASDFTFKPPAGSTKQPAAVSYAQVDAIFKESCMPCHDSEHLKSGLDLSTYQTLQKGADHGLVVEPGKPRLSLLWIDLAHVNRPFMPPNGIMPEYRVRKIERWIGQGAKGP